MSETGDPVAGLTVGRPGCGSAGPARVRPRTGWCSWPTTRARRSSLSSWATARTASRAATSRSSTAGWRPSSAAPARTCGPGPRRAPRVRRGLAVGHARRATPVLLTVAADGTVAECRSRTCRTRARAIDDAPAEDDEREDIRVVPAGEPADEEREIHGVTLRLGRAPLRTTTVTDLAYVDGALLVAGASNEEFVVDAAADPVSRSRRRRAAQLAGDLPRVARQVRDPLAAAHVRPLRRRREHPRRLHLHAGRAVLAGRRWARATRRSGARWPSWAR